MPSVQAPCRHITLRSPMSCSLSHNYMPCATDAVTAEATRTRIEDEQAVNHHKPQRVAVSDEIMQSLMNVWPSDRKLFCFAKRNHWLEIPILMFTHILPGTYASKRR